MKMRFPALLALLFALSPVFAEEAGVTNVPPDPFGDLEEVETARDYTIEVDRSRGSFTLDAEEGQYYAGSHFGNWSWTMDTERWGNYFVGLLYDSGRTKLGIQVKVGDGNVLKGYAPRTNSLKNDEAMILGTAYLDTKGEHQVMMLTGDQSNVPAFQVRGVHFQPAPESEPPGQSINGTITLEAKTATTYSQSMRYEPDENKNCLGFWTMEEDWAEWIFDVSTPGEFGLTLDYGCGPGNEGSEVALLVNDQIFEFVVEDTGGFQSWKSLEFDSVSLSAAGKNKIALVPRSKKGKAVMDLRKISLTPKP